MQHKIIKINQIVGGLYTSSKKTGNLIVYAIGAPLVGDMGALVTAPAILSHGFDVFVPDYLGFCRSQGKFTPQNCVKTLLESYRYMQGSTAIDVRTHKKITIKYNKIYFIGSSFGGYYVGLLPKFNMNIQHIGMIYPVTDYALCGSKKTEESIDDFLQSMQYGYKYLYRGIMNQVWRKHFRNQDNLSLVKNLKFLKDSKVFITHGKQDKCINYKQSVVNFNLLLKKNPESINNYKLKIYPSGRHDKSTSIPAIQDFFKWIKN